MGKKNKGKGKNRNLDSDDDTLSSCSTGALSDKTFQPETEEEETEDLVLENYVDDLYEKRGSTRETGLKGLIQAFTNGLQAEFAEKSYETLLDHFLKSMKRGFPEAALAAHALGLLAITIGAGDMAHKVLMESASQFSRASKPGSDPNYLALIIKSFSVITFVGGYETEETEKSMDILWNQVIKVNKVDNTVRAAAISSWTFLLTTLPSQRINATFTGKQHLSVLSAFLEVEFRAVRIAAGEAIALIFEAMNSADCDVSRWNNADLTDLEEDDQSFGSFSSFESMEKRILEQMKSLSIEAGGKGSSKKDLVNQKSSFRDILMSIEAGEAPKSSVKLQNGCVVNVTNWTETIQLNFLRHFLGGGFLQHMQANSLLHDVFGFRPVHEKQQTLSATEKRLFKSPNSVFSKARTQELNKRRAVKNECLLVE